MEETKIHPKLQAIVQTANGLSEMLGCRYEVIVHDLSHVESSIIALKGNITNRKIGSPVTNYLLRLLKEYGDEAPDSINYRNIQSDGRVLRSSTMFVRDDDGHIIGCLCINQDMTDYIVASKLVSEMVSFPECNNPAAEQGEDFHKDIGEVMESLVTSEINRMNKPITYMQKEDKLGLVEALENKGIFAIKGAVEYVAARIGVTNFTVYNYLKEIRNVKR